MAVLPKGTTVGAVGGVSDKDFSDYARIGVRTFGLGSSLFQPGLEIAEIARRAQAAVSVWELSRLCGRDTDQFCKGVGYGDEMTECIVGHYEKLSPECKPVVDRIRNGEGVSLF